MHAACRRRSAGFERFYKTVTVRSAFGGRLVHYVRIVRPGVRGEEFHGNATPLRVCPSEKDDGGVAGERGELDRWIRGSFDLKEGECVARSLGE